MSSIVRRIAVFGVAALLVGVVAWPAAAREPAQIRINRGSSALQDGSARIALRARCDANLAAFELDVTVQQGAVIGEISTVQAGVVTCDGGWHRVNVVVEPSSGAFSMRLRPLFDERNASSAPLHVAASRAAATAASVRSQSSSSTMRPATYASSSAPCPQPRCAGPVSPGAISRRGPVCP